MPGRTSGKMGATTASLASSVAAPFAALELFLPPFASFFRATFLLAVLGIALMSTKHNRRSTRGLFPARYEVIWNVCKVMIL